MFSRQGSPKTMYSSFQRCEDFTEVGWVSSPEKRSHSGIHNRTVAGGRSCYYTSASLSGRGLQAMAVSVCMSVCLSTVSRAYERQWKLRNQSTWKFRTLMAIMKVDYWMRYK